MEVPLPVADKNKPNLYVKWDYMVKASANPSIAHSHKPSDAVMAEAQSILGSHNIVLSFYPTHDSLTENRVITPAPASTIPACAGSDAISFYPPQGEQRDEDRVD
jgi:hypothetical protein